MVWLNNSDESRIVTFARRFGKDEVIIAINMSNVPFTGSVETTGNYDDITPDIGHPLPPDDEKPKTSAVAKIELPALQLEAFGFRIFKKR